MGESSLNRTPGGRKVTGKGHGTAALGPSDSSDGGSDIRGGPGLNRDDGIGLARGTTSAPDVDPEGANAGPDIGDTNVDADADRYGTGERAAAGRDSTGPADGVLRDDEDRPVTDEGFADDVERESTLATVDDRASTSATERESDTERDVEREEPADERALGKDVEANTPVFDRAYRDDRPGRPR